MLTGIPHFCARKLPQFCSRAFPTSAHGGRGGEIRWPPVGRADGRPWGEPMAPACRDGSDVGGASSSVESPPGGQISASAGTAELVARRPFGRSVVTHPQFGAAGAGVLLPLALGHGTVLVSRAGLFFPRTTAPWRRPWALPSCPARSPRSQAETAPCHLGRSLTSCTASLISVVVS